MPRKRGSRADRDAGVRRAIDLAEALEPETFFQAARSENGRTLVLAFAGEPSRVIRQQLKEAAAPVRAEFRIVAHAMPELEQIADRVSQDLAMWDARGAKISLWGPDWTSNKVQIGLVTHEPVVARAIEAHYGDDLVAVETEDAPFATPC